VYVFLVLSTAAVAFFVAILAGGALVGLARLGMLALHAVAGPREARVQVSLPKPMAPPAHRGAGVRAATFADAQPAYASA
jgi:hypothetical protein